MVEVDVIIVGMGPTGATLAGLLGQRGVRVAVLDRLPDLFPLPRAAGLDHEVMRIMQELGIAERLASHIEPYRPSEYRGMEGQLIQRLDSTPPPFRLGWAPNYVFEQPAFERAIRTRLAELPNVQAECNAEVVAVGQEADHAWADVKLPGHDLIEHYVGRYLVACDGGSSPIRKQLGIKLEDLGFDEPWLVVDAIVSDQKLAELPQTQVQYCEAARPATYVVGVGKHRRWEVMLLPGDDPACFAAPDHVRSLLRRWLAPEDAELERAVVYTFNSVIASRWRNGRLMVAGDAAHQTPPFLGQGLCAGLRDAANLAWKLTWVLDGRGAMPLLDSYQDELRPHVAQYIAEANRIGAIIQETDPERASVRNAMLLSQPQILAPIRPRLGGSDEADTLAGTLAPQPRLRDGQLLDDAAGPRFIVLSRAGVSDQVSAETRLRWEHAGAAIMEDEAAEYLNSLGAQAVIIRPDHYILGVARSAAELDAVTRKIPLAAG